MINEESTEAPIEGFRLEEFNEEQLRVFAYGAMQLAVSLRREKDALEAVNGNLRQKLEIAEMELKEINKFDKKTGFLTAEAFRNSIEDTMHKQKVAAESGWRRSGDNPNMSNFLVFMDLDKFKQLNRVFGNEQVDERILFPAVKKIEGAIRDDNHLISAPGGDEFLLFLPGVDRVVCEAIVKRVKTGINEISIPKSNDGPYPQLWRTLGVSIGVAEYPIGAEYLDVYGEAHAAHLASKDTPGGNRVIFADELAE